MRLSLITLLLLIGSNSFGQINNYQTLLDTALGGHRALFVHSKPLKITRLDTKDIRDYVENLRDWSHESLDTAMFSQIIQNSKLADTTLWTDKELPNSLLVSARDESISKKTAFQKLKLTDV